MREVVVAKPSDNSEDIEKRATPPSESGAPCRWCAVCREHDYRNEAARYGIGETVELHAKRGLEAGAIKKASEAPIEGVSNNSNGHQRPGRSAVVGRHRQVRSTAACQKCRIGKQVAHVYGAGRSGGLHVSVQVVHEIGHGKRL